MRNNRRDDLNSITAPEDADLYKPEDADLHKLVCIAILKHVENREANWDLVRIRDHIEDRGRAWSAPVEQREILTEILGADKFAKLERGIQEAVLHIKHLFTGGSLKPCLFIGPTSEGECYSVESETLRLVHGIVARASFAKEFFLKAKPVFRKFHAEERFQKTSLRDKKVPEADDHGLEDFEGDVSDLQDLMEDLAEFGSELHDDVEANGVESNDVDEAVEQSQISLDGVYASMQLERIRSSIATLLSMTDLDQVSRTDFNQTHSELSKSSLAPDLVMRFSQAAAMRRAAHDEYDRSPTVLAYWKPMEQLVNDEFLTLAERMFQADGELKDEPKVHEVTIAIGALAHMSHVRRQFPIKDDLVPKGATFLRRSAKLASSLIQKGKTADDFVDEIHGRSDPIRLAWIALGIDHVRRIRNGFIHASSTSTPSHTRASTKDIDRMHQFLLGDGHFVDFLTRREEQLPSDAARMLIGQESPNRDKCMTLDFDGVSMLQVPASAPTNQAIPKDRSVKLSFEISGKRSEPMEISLTSEFEELSIRGQAVESIARVFICNKRCDQSCQPQTIAPHPLIDESRIADLFEHIRSSVLAGHRWETTLPDERW